MERRLAAIVCADVAGYSRMMGADEAATHATFKAHRSAVYPAILNHGGRLVKNTGDGFLLEYPSVVGALRSSIEIQALMAERNAQLPSDRLMLFRLGVHMGDVMADEDEVFGDGVNIAVRLESVATPGGIAVSGKAYQEASKHIRVPLIDAGSRRFKNIDEYKQLLLKDKDQLARALTAKLLTYATGAAPDTEDKAEIEAIIKKDRDKNYGFRTLIHEIVQSKIFQTK